MSAAALPGQFTPQALWAAAIAGGSAAAMSLVPDAWREAWAAPPLGATDGPGFGWRDQNVYKFGVQYLPNPGVVLRLGTSYATSVMPQSQTLFGALIFFVVIVLGAVVLICKIPLRKFYLADRKRDSGGARADITIARDFASPDFIIHAASIAAALRSTWWP